MIAKLMSWGVTYLMHSTLLIASVWFASRWIRSAAVRDALWKLALVGGFVTATLQMAMPFEEATRTRVWNTAATTAPMQVDTQTAAAAKAPAIENTDATQRTTSASADAPATRAWRMPARETFVLAWAAMAALLLARLLHGRKRLLTLLGDRHEVVLGADRALVDALATSANCTRVIRLTRSDAITSPLAMLGFEIVVPGLMFARLTDEQRRTILAHELAHLLRRDPLWLTIAEAIKAMFFLQPLNRIAAMKMKETAEFLCDDAAVLQTGDRQALAETLAELASHLTPMPMPVAAMAEGSSNLIVRVTRVLRAHGAPELPLKTRWRIAVAVIPLALIALFAPGVAPAKLASRISGIQSSAQQPAEMENHFVDGVLEHSYEGPEGKTKVSMLAKNTWISQDGRNIRFDNANGFLRATYSATRGAERRVDVTPGPRLTPQYRYSVGGVEKPWCDDAKRLMVAAVLHKELGDITLPDETSTRHESEWNATVEETGTRDGQPLRIAITIHSLHYDRTTGAIDFDRSGSLSVEETVGTRKRQFRLEAGEPKLLGDFEGTTRDERAEWVASLLKRHTTGDSMVVDRIGEMVP